MLNIGGGELAIILLVALVFLGPGRLPQVARQVGQTIATLRGLAQSFQSELEAAAKPSTPELPASDTAAGAAIDAEMDAAERAAAAEKAAAKRNESLAAKAREVGSDSSLESVRPVSKGGPEPIDSVGADGGSETSSFDDDSGAGSPDESGRPGNAGGTDESGEQDPTGEPK